MLFFSYIFEILTLKVTCKEINADTERAMPYTGGFSILSLGLHL